MKNKKGFTLVELMAVIVVLAIVIAIAIPTYSKIKNTIDIKNYANKKELIKIAATKFAEDTNITAIFVKELVENGYLEADDEDGNVYGLDKDLKKININCYAILSEQKNGIYYSDFIDNDYVNEDGTCDYNIPNELTKGFKIVMYEQEETDGKETKLEYDSNKKWWTKKNVVLRTIIPEESKPISKIEWYEGYNNEPIKSINGEILSDNGKTLKVTTNSVLQQNYIAKLTYEDGNILKARVRVYIDKINPNFYASDAKKINDEWKAGELNKDYIDYNIKAYDNESGLYGYKEIGENDVCPTDFESYKKSKKIVLKNNGTRKICLIDNVGNKNEKTITVDHIDNTPMNCNFSVDGTIGGKDNNNLQWYTSSITIKLNPEKIGLSGVTLTMVDEKGKNYYKEMQYNENQEINEYFKTDEINENRKVTVNGTIKNQAGTSNDCSINVGVEPSIVAPTDHKIDTYYNKIIARYTLGSAISGIKNEVCELYDSSNNLKSSYNPGEKTDCIFENLENKEDTKYSIRRCITSYAGNSDCSELREVKIPGYCTSTTTMDNGDAYTVSGSSCSKLCGGGTQAAKQPKIDVSNYNSSICKRYEVDTTLSCNTMSCCSNTYAHTEAWGQCSAKCGGGTQYRNVWYTSVYDGSTCPNGAPPVSSSQSCNTMSCCSSIKAGNPYDITGCSSSCGNGTKTVRTPYYSSYDGSFCKYVDSNASCYLGPCGETYAFELEKYIDDATAVGATSVDISPFLHINNYSYLEYDIKVDSRSLWYSGVCGFNIIGADPDNGLYPLVNGEINLIPHANDILKYKERIDRVYKDTNEVESTPLKSFQTFTVGDVGKFEIRCHAGTNGDRGGKVYVNGTITLYK